jgi:iron complex outermembrane recepter protein
VLIVRARAIVLTLAVSAGGAMPASAQRVPPPDLAGATLEDLMKIQITSASRKEQSAGDVPAAVFVVTQDDIRRSGMRTLPELLRLVPGVQVAQINSSNWAVSIRGFNDQFSNKLLVLVDGRSIYQRVFSGVFWDAEEMVLDDIERIEVIRGPGAAAWGANAVNGVINIVTKSAQETQGALVRVGAGGFDRGQATARYGGSVGGVAYRLYSQWTLRGDTRMPGAPPDDDWRVFTNGARADWSRGADDWMVDAGVRSGDGHTVWTLPSAVVPDPAPRTDVAATFWNSHVLSRWTHRAGSGSSLQVQTSASFLRRTDFIRSDEDTFDAGAQYHAKIGARHDLVAGGGYRFINSSTGRNFAVSFDPADVRTEISSVFAQDEIALPGRMQLTLGTKAEHESLSGSSLQPTARLMWAPGPHHVWIAASRALRTPSLSDLGVRLNAAVIQGEGLPIVVGLLGNPDYQPETLRDVEAGYRVDLRGSASVDVTAFRGRYTGLPTFEPLAPAFETTPAPPHLFIGARQENRLRADTAGIEIAAHVMPMPIWRVDGSYSTFHLTPHPDAGSADAAAAIFDGNAPARQWLVRSSVTLSPRIDLGGTLFHSSSLPNLAVPGYTRADARLTVTLTAQLSAIVVGTNLLASDHAEFMSTIVAATRVPRSVNLQLVWRR